MNRIAEPCVKGVQSTTPLTNPCVIGTFYAASVFGAFGSPEFLEAAQGLNVLDPIIINRSGQFTLGALSKTPGALTVTPAGAVGFLFGQAVRGCLQ